jgi:hypothetical protein
MTKAPPTDDNPGFNRPRHDVSHTHPRPASPSEIAHDVRDPSVDRRGESRDRMVDEHRSIEKRGSYPNTKR